MPIEKIQTAILIGLAFAALLGIFTARSSKRRETIYGGALAHVFHYIGAGLFASIIPMVLISIFFIHPGPVIILIAIGFALASFLVLTLFAVIERPALAKAQSSQDDRGWTEQDARTSGL